MGFEQGQKGITYLFSSQLRYIEKRDLGLDRDHILAAYVYPPFIPKFGGFKNDLLSRPGIKGVTSAAQPPFNVADNIQIDWEGNTTGRTMSADYTCVDYDLFQTFDMQIIQGCAFSRDFTTDEATARVIGVVRDFHSRFLHTDIRPFVFRM